MYSDKSIKSTTEGKITKLIFNKKVIFAISIFFVLPIVFSYFLLAVIYPTNSTFLFIAITTIMSGLTPALIFTALSLIENSKKFYLQILPHFILLVLLLVILSIPLLVKNSQEVNLFNFIITEIKVAGFFAIFIFAMRSLERLKEKDFYEWVYFLSAGLNLSIIMGIFTKFSEFSFAKLLCAKINFGIFFCNEINSYILWFFIAIFVILCYFEIIDKYYRER